MKRPAEIVAPQSLANKVLLWCLEDQTICAPARVMAGVAVFGPGFARGEKNTRIPRDLGEFICCLSMVEDAAPYWGRASFNRIRTISPEWNRLVEHWDLAKRIVHANRHKEKGPAMVRYADKEVLYSDFLSASFRELPASWTVPVGVSALATIRRMGGSREIEFLGSNVGIKTVPEHLLPPLCLGVCDDSTGRAHYLLSAEAATRADHPQN